MQFTLKCNFQFGAGGGGRTRTLLPERDFEFYHTLCNRTHLAELNGTYYTQKMP